MFLCMSDHSSAHIKYQLFGLYMKIALHNIPFGFKIFSILTCIKFDLFVTKYNIYNITQVTTVVFCLFIHRSILSMLH